MAAGEIDPVRRDRAAAAQLPFDTDARLDCIRNDGVTRQSNDAYRSSGNVWVAEDWIVDQIAPQIDAIEVQQKANRHRPCSVIEDSRSPA